MFTLDAQSQDQLSPQEDGLRLPANPITITNTVFLPSPEPAASWIHWVAIFAILAPGLLLFRLYRKRTSIREILRFAWKQQRRPLTAAATTMAIGWLAMLFAAGPTRVFWDYFQVLTGLATLAAAVLIWFSEAAQDREENLEKRLQVVFACEWKNPVTNTVELLTVMVCEYVYLASESDIRLWGQQIGAQMSGGDSSLSFSPDILQQAGSIHEADEANPLASKRYRVLFQLNRLPLWGGKEQKPPDPKPDYWDSAFAELKNWNQVPREIRWPGGNGRYRPLQGLHPSRRVIKRAASFELIERSPQPREEISEPKS